MSRLPSLLLLLLLLSCQRNSVVPERLPISTGQFRLLQKAQQQPLTTIALGSCNRQDLPQPHWAHIQSHDPDVWIWLGDNIYGDTEDMAVLAKKYRMVKQHPGYKALTSTTPVIGIWDDHDYGVNDGDQSYPYRRQSQQILLDFLDVPADAPVRKQAGAYQSFTFGPAGKQVKVLLLDARYHREALTKAPPGGPRYLPNPTGMILGEAQWAWLEKELTHSDAEVHVIGSGIQFIAEEQGYEKWANFPTARKRFFDLLARTKAKVPVLISGDRHIAEVNRIEWPGLPQPLTELTSSGLTHTWSRVAEEPNRYRVGSMIIDKNYALLEIDWAGTTPHVWAVVRQAETDRVLLREQLY